MNFLTLATERTQTGLLESTLFSWRSNINSIGFDLTILTDQKDPPGSLGIARSADYSVDVCKQHRPTRCENKEVEHLGMQGSIPKDSDWCMAT